MLPYKDKMIKRRTKILKKCSHLLRNSEKVKHIGQCSAAVQHYPLAGSCHFLGDENHRHYLRGHVKKNRESAAFCILCCEEHSMQEQL